MYHGSRVLVPWVVQCSCMQCWAGISTSRAGKEDGGVETAKGVGYSHKLSCRPPVYLNLVPPVFLNLVPRPGCGNMNRHLYKKHDEPQSIMTHMYKRPTSPCYNPSIDPGILRLAYSLPAAALFLPTPLLVFRALGSMVCMYHIYLLREAVPVSSFTQEV